MILEHFLKLSPLRTEEDRQSLIRGINKDLIEVLVSDHKPEDEVEKAYILTSSYWSL